ncbi:MAG: hypothetical protein GXO47_12295, partial [Chlorobi bacterium]|nr:hypothetical protein [Chlorobiota bacterium]
MNTGINIEIKECKDAEKWSDDLENFRFSLFQTKEWIEALSSEKNNIPVFYDLYFNGYKAGKISGIFNKTKYFGSQIYFFSGPALKSSDYNLYHNLTDSLIKYFKEKGVSRIIIGSYGSHYAPEIKHRLYHTFKRKEYLVNLTGNFHKRFSHNVKNNITKAKKNNLSVSI